MRILWSILGLLVGCPVKPPAPPAAGLPPRCGQVLVVCPNGPLPKAEVTAWQREGDAWRMFGKPMPATIGRAGIALATEKREGDGCTPAGVYSLGPAFGYAPTIKTGLNYRCATPNDYWIDDATSPNYNQWVTATSPPLASHERLRRDDNAYFRAVVINYNTDPIVPGRGSAIFLHVWSGADQPTAGCVALAKGDMLKLMPWLIESRSPHIAILPDRR